MTRNRKVLYRRLSATALSLFAALAFAPELGFKPAKLLPSLAKNDEHHVKAKTETSKPEQRTEQSQTHPQPKVETPQQPSAEQYIDEQDTDFATNLPATNNRFDTTTFGDDTQWIPAPLWASFGPRFSGGSSGSSQPINTVVASNGTSTKPVIGTSNPAPTTGGNGGTGGTHNDEPGQPNNGKPSNNGSPTSGNPTGGSDGHQPPAGDQGKPDIDTHTNNGDHHPVVTVPEPSSLALLAVGIIGLVIARRRVI